MRLRISTPTQAIAAEQLSASCHSSVTVQLLIKRRLIFLFIRVFGTEDLATRAEIDKVPALLEGAVFPGNHVSDKFLESYVSKYNDDSRIAHAAYSYEFAKYLPALLGELNGASLSNETIRSGLSSMKTVDGVLGHVERLKGPHGELAFSFPVVMRTIFQGRATDSR